MNTEALAYLAGVIDSDGCIRVEMLKHANQRGVPSYSAFVSIQQVEKEAVLLAKETLGGFLMCPKAPKRFPDARPMTRWTAKGKVATAALIAVLPYLRIKKAQAENAIALGQLTQTINSSRFEKGRSGPRQRTGHETASLHTHFERSRFLNSGHRSQQTGLAI